MARKTLGKMEFENLIKTLQEQNSEQLTAQQETTKGVRSLHAYFIKQDRADTRRRLEDEMENYKNAESVPNKPKGKGFSGRLPTKGLLGSLAEFLITGILGAKGGALFRGLFRSLKFAPSALLTFGRLLGAAILVPDLAHAFGEAFKEDSLAEGLKTFIKEFFGGKKGQTFAEQMMSNVAKGGLLGFAAFGPKGAIIGAILGGAFTALDETLGLEKTIELGTYLKDYLFGATGFALLGGAALLKSRYFKANLYKGGFKGLARMGPAGFLAMALIGGTLSSLSKTLTGGGPDGLGDTIWNTLFGSNYSGGFSIAESAFWGGTVAKLFGYGLPGLILGASVGIAFKNADDAMRRDMGKGLGDALYDAFSDFWGHLNDLVGSWLGNKKAEARLAMSGHQGKKFDLINELTSQQGMNERGEIRKSMWPTFLERTRARRPEITDEKEIANLTSKSTGSDEAIAMVNFELLKRKFGDDKLFKKIFKGTPGKDLTINYDLLHENLIHGLGEKLGLKQKSLNPFGTDIDSILELMQDIGANRRKAGIVEANSDALGAKRYTAPALTIVGDAPSQGEMIFTDRQFERMANAIATQKENQTLSAIMPMMMGGGGGGGASMPVVNNSYSYQNVDNVVTELPATSILNMTNALA